MRKKILKIENLTFVAALLGVAIGVKAPAFALESAFLGELFVLLLKAMIVPLVFSSVFIAIAKPGSKGELASIGSKTFLYFLATSSLACLTGLLAAQFLPAAAEGVVAYGAYDGSQLGSLSLKSVLMSFFTGNPFKALADGQIIQIVVFAILLGMAAVRIEAKKKQALFDVFEAGHDTIMVIVGWIVMIAPLGVFSLVATVVAKTEMSQFAGLAWFFVATAIAALIHVLVTLPAVGFYVGGFHPYRFMWNVREALLVALATASSSATLPVSSRVLEERENVSAKTTGFVLPLGSTLNMNGSALYQALVVIFLGRVAGIEFSLVHQVLIFFFVLLSAAGTAGIPGGGLMMMGAVLQMVGVPMEFIGLYLLVDRFWDAPITVINVLDDLFGAKVIDKFLKRR